MRLTTEQLEYLHRIVNKDRKQTPVSSKDFHKASIIMGEIVKDIKSNSCCWCHGSKSVMSSNGFYMPCQFCK